MITLLNRCHRFRGFVYQHVRTRQNRNGERRHHKSPSVLTIYVDLPDTPLQASASDQWLARRRYDDRVPLHVVETALLLGSLRRLIRPADAPRLSAIRSLAYFRPV